MNRTPITRAEAVTAFGTRKPKVQTAKRAKVPYRDDAGAEQMRDGFVTSDDVLKEEHILSAVRYDDGRVVIVTIDGNKHVAQRVI